MALVTPPQITDFGLIWRNWLYEVYSCLNARVIVGEIIVKASDNVPDGYLECDGTAVSRATYSALFDDIGTTYGVGDGSTTFNLPDFRGEFLRGWDNSRGVDSGRAIASTQSDAFKDHTHQHDAISTTTYGGGTSYAALQTYVATDSVSGPANGSGSETRPRNIAVMYCIKY